MPTQALTTKPARQGRARQSCKQTKLQMACKKAFKALKQPISGIKKACSPLNTGVISYEIDSNLFLTVADWIINPPPADDKFKAINNATQDQQITDERYPIFAVVLPAATLPSSNCWPYWP